MSAPAVELRDVSFAYPGGKAVLSHVSLAVEQGAFVLLTGDTGAGKTTLLRLCKPEIRPAGELSGAVRVCGRDVGELDARASAEAVGYVFQNPDNQIVCDTVWHEMAFGLENLGLPQPEMRLRVAETCYFLGIEPWFRRPCAELSGGQRQVLALAATLVMRPRVLLLDEPTAMLDPIAEKGFLSLLFRANRELGMTVVVATHTPQTMGEYATEVVRLAEGGGAVLAGEASQRGPSPLAGAAGAKGDSPLWLTPFAKEGQSPFGTRPHGTAAKRGLSPMASAASQLGTVPFGSRDPAPLRIRSVWQRYVRDDDWVLRDTALELLSGEARALVGGNGCGKSTLLGVAAGTLRPVRGKVRSALRECQALLPQSPKALLSHETVRDELMAWSDACGYGQDEADALLRRMGLGDDADLQVRHPYDLSGGQQQLVALAKLLLARPRLLLLDEPTKGLDPAMRRTVAALLHEARATGATLLVATHDLAFARDVCDTVSLLFDGQVACTLPCEEFFAQTQFFVPGGASLRGEEPS